MAGPSSTSPPFREENTADLPPPLSPPRKGEGNTGVAIPTEADITACVDKANAADRSDSGEFSETPSPLRGGVRGGGAAPDLPEEATLDAFHRGRFWLTQPSRGGHRAGMDAMMLAAAVPDGFAGSLADFGAGAGAAGLAVAARCGHATVALVENSPVMADYARKSLALPENAAIAARCHVIEADLTLTGPRRAAAGLADNVFDFVIMNPPFNASADRATPHDLKRSAHVMADGMVEAWIRSAAAVVRPRGGFAAIIRPATLPPLLAALAGRFGSARIKPIHPHDNAPAIRVIVRAIYGSRGQLTLEPPLVLHEAGSSRPSAAAADINNGHAGLFGD